MANEKIDCACPDCVCKVSPDTAVNREGKSFCSEECAAGHPNHTGCDHDGCNCKG